jgi:hypothetical protein
MICECVMVLICVAFIYRLCAQLTNFFMNSLVHFMPASGYLFCVRARVCACVRVCVCCTSTSCWWVCYAYLVRVIRVGDKSVHDFGWEVQRKQTIWKNLCLCGMIILK